MKEYGSLIAILVIVGAMVFLASLLYDSLRIDATSAVSVREEYQTYSESAVSEHGYTDQDLIFENFPVPEGNYDGNVAAVDMSGVLSAISKDTIMGYIETLGPNFAGKYTIVTWGCGVDCQHSVVVDRENGEIINHGILAAHGLSYSKDSRLLIVNPEENLPSGSADNVSYVTDYYVLDENERLVLIAKKVHGENIIRSCSGIRVEARNPLTNITALFDTPCVVPYGWEITQSVE